MDRESQVSSTQLGKPIQTACGGYVFLEENTPQTIFNGRQVYFCLPTCRDDFLRDPQTSCMAGDLFSSEK
jgi:YHS domain-containing protein